MTDKPDTLRAKVVQLAVTQTATLLELTEADAGVVERVIKASLEQQMTTALMERLGNGMTWKVKLLGIESETIDTPWKRVAWTMRMTMEPCDD